MTLPDGECFKDLHHIEKILSAAVDAGLDRKSYIVALGGGVIGDMAGFAASMWMRGIDFHSSAHDALGAGRQQRGRQNRREFAGRKNLIGAFHQPRSVIADTTVLKTLPQREISAGVAEIIKYGMLGDAEFFCLSRREHGGIVRLGCRCGGDGCGALLRNEKRKSCVRTNGSQACEPNLISDTRLVTPLKSSPGIRLGCTARPWQQVA